MMGLVMMLLVLAFLLGVASAAGKAPLWVSVILLALAALVERWPR